MIAGAIRLMGRSASSIETSIAMTKPRIIWSVKIKYQVNIVPY